VSDPLEAADWETVERLLELADPEQTELLNAALRERVVHRLLHWRCKVDGCDGLPHDGGFEYRHARAAQHPPDLAGLWEWWLMLAGRGAGKTRTGAETVKDGLPQSLLNFPGSRWAGVGRTFSDARDVMVEGESGLLSVLPYSVLRGGTVSDAWNRSMGELYLDNGSRFDIYTSERPAQLRGPQFHGAWGDEPAHWLDAHKGETEDSTWSNLNLTLRLGPDPRGILTTTPARVRWLIGTKEHPGVKDQAGVHITRGRMADNAHNLAPAFRRRIEARYAGTRIGRQELDAEILEDVEGALWSMATLDRDRIDSIDPGLLDLLLIAVDPNVTDTPEGQEPTADECGVVVVGVASECPICGPDPHARGAHAFVLDDLTTQAGPNGWPGEVVDGYDQWGADRVVAEANNGGDLVIGAIRAVDPRVPVTKVIASRGKRTRAEPVAQLSEQGRLHMVGSHPELEEQMTGWIPRAGDSPDRLDALVWGCTEGVLAGPPGRHLRFEE
jgi:phage terminase large subunit-like protein